jgi:glycosyltransferase involved in cell wall biosynthesis
MRQHGFELSFISSPAPELDAFGEEEEAEVFAVEMPRRITPLRDLKALACLYASFRRIRPDAVHSHTPKAGLLGTVAAALARVPVRIYHMRGLPLMGETGLRRALLTMTERASCHAATHVLAVSHGLRDEAIRRRLCGPARIQVLGHGSGQGVDVRHFDPDRLPAGTHERVRSNLGIAANATVVGFVGRLVGDKGIGELAEAWRILRDEHPETHLVLVGPFEERDPVPADVRTALESDPRVHLLGFRSDLAELYAAMDLVTLPSYREGFPNVPLEAAAMRIPVVATDIPGMRDAVADGETGLLVAPRDSAALWCALSACIRDPELRARYGVAGRKRAVQLFDRRQVHDHLVQFYRSLLFDEPWVVSLLQASAHPEPMSRND